MRIFYYDFLDDNPEKPCNDLFEDGWDDIILFCMESKNHFISGVIVSHDYI